jgi:hypothetical protein
MVLIEVYFNVKDTIKNAVDLITPIEGFTHKSTKAELYDLHNNLFVGCLFTDIRGSSTPDDSRVRSCQTNIIIGDFKINIPHGSKGLFNSNLEEPHQFTYLDFNGVNTSVNLLNVEGRGYISIIQ